MNISRTALVSYNALDMYRLVHDVRAYPEFLSWCTHAEVLEDTAELQVASLAIAVGGVSQRFTTRNRLKRGEQLTMSLIEGPFQQLNGAWAFSNLGDDGSKISLDLSFEVASKLMSGAFSRGFSHIADRLVRDFCLRAERVYDVPS